MPERTISDSDAKAIANAISESLVHPCRFPDIHQDDLAESIKFYKSMNKVAVGIGSTVGKTVLVLLIGGLVALMSLGTVSKIKELMGP